MTSEVADATDPLSELVREVDRSLPYLPEGTKVNWFNPLLLSSVATSATAADVINHGVS